MSDTAWRVLLEFIAIGLIFWTVYSYILPRRRARHRRQLSHARDQNLHGRFVIPLSERERDEDLLEKLKFRLYALADGRPLHISVEKSSYTGATSVQWEIDNA